MSRQVLTYPDMPPVLTQGAADLRYLQQAQADLLYAPVAHNHDAAYLKLTGGELTGGLLITTPVGGGYALRTTRGDSILYNHGGLHLADSANTISGGFRWRDSGGGVEYLVNGAPVGTQFEQNGSLTLSGTLNARPGAEGLAGEWLMDTNSVRKSFVGLDGDPNTWRVYSNHASSPGNKLSINLADGYVSIPGGLGVSGTITTTGGVTGNGGVFNLASTANIQLSPAGTYIHPSGNNTINLGHPGLNWCYVWTYNVNSPGGAQLGINGGFHLILTASNGGWIYHRSTGHNFFDGSSGAIVAPEIDNKLICGGTGNRWQYVAAVNGGINTCFEHEKAIVGEIDPEDALDAIRQTPFFLYHPKDFEGNVDETMTFAGPVNTSVDPRLQIGEGALTAAGHQAAYACAAVKALSSRLDALERLEAAP